MNRKTIDSRQNKMAKSWMQSEELKSHLFKIKYFNLVGKEGEKVYLEIVMEHNSTL